MEGLVVIWFICACVSAVIVNSKTNSQAKVGLYFILGLVIGIFGILLAVAAPNEKDMPALNGGQPTRTCPFCKELILADAIKCKHCGERLDEAYARLSR